MLKYVITEGVSENHLASTLCVHLIHWLQGFLGFLFFSICLKNCFSFSFFQVLNFSLLSPQLAQGQDGSFRRFAVLEFATAEMAEEAQRLTDGRLLGGTHIRVSFCAPGPPGRSMLAALIAAQTMVLYSNLQSLLEPLRHNIAAFEFDIPAVMERVTKCVRFSFFGESVLMCERAGPTLHPMLQERDVSSGHHRKTKNSFDVHVTVQGSCQTKLAFLFSVHNDAQDCAVVTLPVPFPLELCC